MIPELPALRLPLQRLLKLPVPGPVVILTGLREPLLQLQDDDRASPFVREISSPCRFLEDTNWNLII